MMDEARLDAIVDRITDQVMEQLTRDERRGSPSPQWLVDPLNDTRFRSSRPDPGDLLREGPDRVGTLPLAGAEGSLDAIADSIAGIIDHTLLKPDATPEEIDRLCQEACEHRFLSVCVNPLYVRQAASRVAGSDVRVCAVVGFPLGSTLTDVKAYETRRTIEEGASEIDMVLPVGMLKAGRHGYVAHDILEVVRAAGPRVPVKVILETCLLDDAEKAIACRIARESGASFVKTSTGFSSGGATPEDVRLMRREVGSALGVKASGGIRDLEGALRMVASGANRIGASASVEISEGAPSPAGTES